MSQFVRIKTTDSRDGEILVRRYDIIRLEKGAKKDNNVVEVEVDRDSNPYTYMRTVDDTEYERLAELLTKEEEEEK